jgi:hypothetical protein
MANICLVIHLWVHFILCHHKSFIFVEFITTKRRNLTYLSESLEMDGFLWVFCFAFFSSKGKDLKTLLGLSQVDCSKIESQQIFKRKINLKMIQMEILD